MIRLLVLLPIWVFAPTTALTSSTTTTADTVLALIDGIFVPNATASAAPAFWPVMFKIYNFGIIGCMMVVMSFSVLFGIGVMASDGAGLARKLNAWVFIRSILGIVLLIPGPTRYHNYGLIQIIVLKIVGWSIFLCQFVFSGITLSGSATGITGSVSDVNARLVNVGIQNSYTQMVSMAYCALSHEPDMTVTASNGTRFPVRLRWNAGSGSQGYYQFGVNVPSSTSVTVPQPGSASCGQINLSREDPQYVQIMSQIIGFARTATATMIRHAQDQFDTNLASTTPVQYTGQNSLSSDYCLGALGCSGRRPGCWDEQPLVLSFPGYTGLMRNTTQPTSSSMGTLSLDSLIYNFYSLTDTLFNGGTITTPTYAVPTISGRSSMSAKPFVNWQDTSTVTQPALSATETAAITQVARENFARARDQGALNGRSEQDFIDQETIRVRQIKARQEISNEVYRRVFERLGTNPPTWYTQSSTTTSARSAYTGSNNIKTKIAQIIDSIDIPKTNPSVSALDVGGIAGLDVHIIQKKMDIMLERALAGITGCNKHGCNLDKGLFGYQARANSSTQASFSPVAYIQQMGMDLLDAGVAFQSEAIMGHNEGILAQDDLINRKVYGATAGVLISAVATTSAASMYPVTSHLRAVVLVVNGVAAALIETFGYLGDIDQYALYKFEPLGSAISSLLMIWGGLFGAFLPAVPGLIVMFAVLGWVFLVIEAMMASPLICLGLTHPNSHQFLGSSDQTLMMFLLVALRPVTIMIGCFISVFLSKNAIYLLNEGIIRFMEIYFATMSPGSAEVCALLMGMMAVYSYVVFIILIQSYSVIGMLPDKIGSWIGMGPMGGVNPMQQVLSLRSQFEGGAQSLSQGASGAGKTKRAAASESTVRYGDILSASQTGARMGALAGTRAKSILKKAGNDKDKLRKAAKILSKGLSGNTRDLARKLISSDKFSIKEKTAILRQLRKTKSLAGLMGSAGRNFGVNYLDVDEDKGKVPMIVREGRDGEGRFEPATEVDADRINLSESMSLNRLLSSRGIGDIRVTSGLMQMTEHKLASDTRGDGDNKITRVDSDRVLSGDRPEVSPLSMMKDEAMGQLFTRPHMAAVQLMTFALVKGTMWIGGKAINAAARRFDERQNRE